MLYRHLLTDVGLALMLAIPLALSRPDAPPPQTPASAAASPVELALR